MEYVYVIVKVYENGHISVEVFEKEELAKVRAQLYKTKYFKRRVRNELGGVVVLDKGDNDYE